MSRPSCGAGTLSLFINVPKTQGALYFFNTLPFPPIFTSLYVVDFFCTLDLTKAKNCKVFWNAQFLLPFSIIITVYILQLFSAYRSMVRFHCGWMPFILFLFDVDSLSYDLSCFLCFIFICTWPENLGPPFTSASVISFRCTSCLHHPPLCLHALSSQTFAKSPVCRAVPGAGGVTGTGRSTLARLSRPLNEYDRGT